MSPPPRLLSRVEVFPEHRFALAQFRGKVDGDAIVDVGAEIVAHPDWRPGFTEVWDIRECTADVSPSQLPRMRAAEESWKEALAGSRTVVIIDRPLIRFSLEFYARMVRPLGREIQVCETAEDAAALLGVGAIPDLMGGADAPEAA